MLEYPALARPTWGEKGCMFINPGFKRLVIDLLPHRKMDILLYVL